MSVHLVTFSDANMDHSAAVCITSAMARGVDSYRHLTPELLKRWAVVEAHPEVFRQPEDSRRAWSWWAFKPLIIENTMQFCSDGDLICYADAGIEFIGNVSYIIDHMDQDILLFGNNWEHAHWCKADVIKEVWPWIPPERAWDGDEWRNWFPFAKQCQASVIFFRVTDHTRAFVKEWLDWCLFEGGRLIDDSPSRAPNHPEFREHRHDQAILTTMAYREGLKLHYWPASYNDGAFVYEKLPEYAGDDYPILFNHHRRRNHEWASAA